MKGILILELFGEDTKVLSKIYRNIFEACFGELGVSYFYESIGPIPKRSSWVAEIQGPDPQYGLSRKFLRGKIDYSKSNSKGSRGIFIEFVLSPGKIYQVKSQISWKNTDEFFCTVGETGDIIRLDEEFVCHKIFNVLTKKEAMDRKGIKIAEIIGPDDRYFFKRKFLECDYSYIEDDKISDYPGYTLQPGVVYEIKVQHRRGGINKYYCIISEDGKEKRLSENEACRAVGALTREERWEKKRAEALSWNQCPGSGQGSDQQDI